MNRRLGIIIALASLWIFGSQVLHAGVKINVKPLERIKLDLSTYNIYHRPSEAVKTKDGYVILFNESRFGDGQFMVKVDNAGKFKAGYKKNGNGPGETRKIRNLLVTDTSILVCEFFAPYIHELDHNLKFKKDHRIKLGGYLYDMGECYGVWNNYTDDSGKYVLALYKKENLEFVRYAFPVKDFPPYVQVWGGMCKIDGNRYAGVYSNIPAIHIFDASLNLEKRIPLKMHPGFYPYTKAPGDPHVFNNESLAWMESWSKMHTVYWVDGFIVVDYMHHKETVWDLYTPEGKCVDKSIKIKDKNINISNYDGQCYWFIDTEEDDDGNMNSYIVKTQFSITRNGGE